MLLLWTQADILSLVGTIVLYLHASIIIMGWYHYIVGVLMITTVLYYTNKKDTGEQAFRRQLSATIIFITVNTLICIGLNVSVTSSQDIIGEILGWITMSLYLIGRFPQMWLNYKNKSTQGLSLLMYIFTMLGNATYIGVITLDPETIRVNMPWIVTGVSTIFLDLFIIGQHYYYGIFYPHQNENVMVA